jgi:hypothetical protein
VGISPEIKEISNGFPPAFQLGKSKSGVNPTVFFRLQVVFDSQYVSWEINLRIFHLNDDNCDLCVKFDFSHVVIRPLIEGQ